MVELEGKTFQKAQEKEVNNITLLRKPLNLLSI